MSTYSRLFYCLLLCNFIARMESTILLYHLQISQINQTFTQTFSSPFQNFPIFAYFIEGGTIQNSEFSVDCDETLTILTSSQIVINFYTNKSNAFSGNEVINIALLITDEGSSQFQIGVKRVNLSTSFSLTFPSLMLVNNSAAYGMIEVYSTCYPIIYNETLNLNYSNTLDITMVKLPPSFRLNINFGYIYYTSNYVSERILAVFKQFNQNIYNFQVPYQPFAFTPSASNTMFALRQYDSSTVPFLNCQTVADYSYITGDSPQMLIGYTFSSGTPTTFNSDAFFFNSSYSGCPDSQFLYYIELYQTLPYSCIPCDPTCLQCTTNSIQNPALTDENSCTSCVWLRYLNASSYGTGSCVCLPGVDEVNGVCQDCQQSCLTFSVAYIETTNTSNFLLQYSMGTVVEQVSLDNNLQVYINNIQVEFDFSQQQDSYYIISLSLTDMAVCQGIVCQVYFFYLYPQYVLTESLQQSLSNNNQTVQIKNYIDYYSYVPASLKQAFKILGITIGMAFSGGYSSLVTILFQVEQLIDAHRYLKLSLPVVFNELLMSMVYFRFLSILNLLPNSYSQQIQNVVPNDLDCFGPPKLLYYQNGLNFYKNTITAFISVGALLVINFILYQILKLMPWKLTRRLAKKIEIRKFITIHDTLQQLQLPCMFFALEQLQVNLLHADLIWIYVQTLCVSVGLVMFPFIIVIYIYNHKNNKAKIQIYQDLLQDNTMSQKVTYVYYVFNYYRKIFFAMGILSIIPGLVQIYLLITLNSLHLAFQVYLVVARTYKSKMKIVIRFTNDICIIAIEIMILLYNLNDYPKDTMINIGTTCLYLTVISTLMGILDVFVKVADTFLQQIRSKTKEEESSSNQKLDILKEFKHQIKCNLGDYLKDRPKDPKEIKFMEDKELMENTFNKDNQSDKISVHLSEKGQSNGEGLDLVFIDDDWEEVYPSEAGNFQPKNVEQTQQIKKEEINQNQKAQDVQIPQKIKDSAGKVNSNIINSRRNKYQPQERDLKRTAAKKSIAHQRIKQTKDIRRTNTLMVTNKSQKVSNDQIDPSQISDIISQQ